MENLLNWLKGKKSYIIALAMVVLGFLQGTDILIVPEWVWGILAALGLATLRAGVTKIGDAIKTP